MFWLQVWRPRTSHRTPGVRSSHRHPGGVPSLRLRSPSPAYALTSSSICICVSYSRGDRGAGTNRQNWLFYRTFCSVISRHDRLTRFFYAPFPCMVLDISFVDGHSYITYISFHDFFDYWSSRDGSVSSSAHVCGGGHVSPLCGTGKLSTAPHISQLVFLHYHHDHAMKLNRRPLIRRLWVFLIL
jgi:hypothetical protein